MTGSASESAAKRGASDRVSRQMAMMKASNANASIARVSPGAAM